MAKKVRGEDGNYYKVKSPFYKKWWFWLIVVIIIVIAFPKSDKDKKDTSKSSSSATSQNDSSKTSSSSEKQEAKAFSIGEPVQVGDVIYTINSKEIKDTVGTQYTSKTANSKFLVLDVTIQNNSNKAITISDDFFKLYKGETEFKTDSSASISANQESGGTGTEFFYQELNPESSLSGKVVFDVNEETISNPETKIQVQTGVWGTEKEFINLN